MVGFRVDANEYIGLGHLMRCLSIADSIKKTGLLPVFIVADEKGTDLITSKGFRYICLGTKYNDMIQEIPVIEKVISQECIDKIIVDSYYVTDSYFREIRNNVELIYIDDIHADDYMIDIVINYNIYAEDMNYKWAYNEKNKKMLIGPKYVPLRNEFKNVHRTINKEIKKVLITSGGSDQHSVIDTILDMFINNNKFSEYYFTCIIGKFNHNQKLIQEKYGRIKNIELINNSENIAKLMCESDVCITAGGSTLYELCACGTPSILYIIADNQINAANKFSQMGLIPCIGDFRGDKHSCLELLEKEMCRISNYSIRETVSKKMQSIVDGYGADRIAEIIV